VGGKGGEMGGVEGAMRGGGRKSLTTKKIFQCKKGYYRVAPGTLLQGKKGVRKRSARKKKKKDSPWWGSGGKSNRQSHLPLTVRGKNRHGSATRKRVRGTKVGRKQ